MATKKKRAKKKATRKHGSITHIKRTQYGFSFRQFAHAISVMVADGGGNGVVEMAGPKGIVISTKRASEAGELIRFVGEAIDAARELSGWEKTEGWKKT